MDRKYTKLSRANVPKRKQKKEKLGLLTEGRTKMAAFRMTHTGIELLNDLVKKHKTRFRKLSQAEVLEIGLLLLEKLNHDQFEKAFLEYLDIV